jgi:hypothetical protein
MTSSTSLELSQNKKTYIAVLKEKRYGSTMTIGVDSSLEALKDTIRTYGITLNQPRFPNPTEDEDEDDVYASLYWDDRDCPIQKAFKYEEEHHLFSQETKFLHSYINLVERGYCELYIFSTILEHYDLLALTLKIIKSD